MFTEWRFRAVEEILKDFPKIVREKNAVARCMEAGAVFPGVGDNLHVEGGKTLYQQDRYLDMPGHKYLEMLNHIVDVVYNAYNTLNEREQRAIALTCFSAGSETDNNTAAENMNISIRHFYNLKAAALAKMKNSCMVVLPEVEKWRDFDCKRLKAGLRSLDMAIDS